MTENGIYFKNIKVKTSHKTELFVDSSKWNINTNIKINPSYDWETETISYADLKISNLIKQNHGGHKITVTIIGGITFEIETFPTHRNVNFKLCDYSLLSNRTHGVIGQFLPKDSYKVIKKEQNKGIIFYKHFNLKVNFQNHAHNKNCWV